jgi:ubiquinone/menaquinone biosynthesis C-methylase UbiE
MDDNLRRVIAHHDEEAPTYDTDIAGMILYNKITLDNIRRFLPEDHDGLILDAGGGTGFWAIQLAEMGYRVVLTDISTGMLDKARENVTARGLGDRIDIRLSDIRDMPEFSDGQFAMVICEGDPVSYCGDHEAAVRELARVVRKSGAVIVSVDNRARVLNWLKQSDDLGAIERAIQYGEILVPAEREELRFLAHAFTPQELRDLFESNGLTVERILGKPVFAGQLGLSNSADPVAQERLCEIELEYCDDPAYVTLGGHLEIAGRKR